MLKRYSNWLIILLLLVIYISNVFCSNSSRFFDHQINSRSFLSDLSNLPKSRGYDWYLDGYGHDVYGKSDYYWLIPLVIVIGFAALLLPLLTTLMTTMLTSGTLTLSAGRRRRRNVYNEKLNTFGNSNTISESLLVLLTQLENAINKFGKDINEKFKN